MTTATPAPAPVLPRCAFCGRELPARKGAGRPSEYCPGENGGRDSECRRGGEALAALAKVLPKRPEALVRLMEAIEAINVSTATLDDAQLRKVRAAAFTVASRGRRLNPGSSGRYTPKGKAKADPS